MDGGAVKAVRNGCSVTVLRTAEGRRATKRWRWNATLSEWTKISYEAGAWFTPREHQVSNLHDLVEVLDAARRDPRAFVVRGALAPCAREQVEHDPKGPIRRRKHAKADKQTGQIVTPTLVEVARRWVMIDIDGWPLPNWADLVDDPEAAIEHAVHELLPETFRDAACWWQLSSSAGFSAGVLKVHLFYWLSEPAENAHIKAVLKQSAPGVDRAPFSAAQPHYIVDPIIEGGHDPLPRRTGWLKGLEPAVQLPPLKPMVQQARPVGTGATGRVGDVLDALALLGDGENGEGFHGPLRLATLRYARRCARYGDRDDDALKQDLQERIKQAPRRADRGEMGDYDDAYLQRLIDGAFALVQAGDAEIQTMRLHHQGPANTVEDAREAITEHVGEFLSRALAWHRLGAAEQAQQPPEHAALVVGVGVGKSTQAREALPAFISAARGDGQDFEQSVMEGRAPHRVLWLVPTHKLGNETLAEMARLELKAAVMRGRDAELPGTGDPENDIPAERMCLNLEAVEDALKIGEDVERSVCGTGKPDKPSCPYFGQCAYQRQKKTVARADVVIASHQALFHRLPKEVSKGLGLVIVDEAWWQNGLAPNRETRLAGFADVPLSYPVRRKAKIEGRKLTGVWRLERDEEATNDLHVLSARAEAAFASIPEGELVSKEAVLAAGLSASDCAEALKLEWRRKIEGVIHPGMRPDARREAVLIAEGNATIPRRAGIWTALEELLKGEATHTGRLQMSTRSGVEGPARVVLLHTRQPIRDDIAELPILCMDATMPVQIVRYYLPRLAVLAEVQASAPHMELHQVTGGWGKTSLVTSDRAAPEENRRRQGLVGELADFVRLNSGGNALVITYEAIEQSFAGPGIRTGHFNAIAGLDVFRDVRSLFVIGRPLPDGRELRAAALALTGRAIQPEDGQRETRGVLMADGSGAAMNVRAFADPDLEALRVAITESEVIQAIGRGRGVNRNADTPLSVFVLADVALPLPVTRLAAWEHVRPDVLARMRARGVVLLGATDAAKAYPDLFPTPEAARKAIQRSGVGGYFPDIPLGSILLGVCPGNRLVEVEYRPGGRGQQERRAWASETVLKNLPTWLEALVGPLVHYAEHVPEPPPPPPMAEKPPVRPQPPPDAAEAPAPVRVPLMAVRPAAPEWAPLSEDRWTGPAPPHGSAAPAVEATWGAVGDD